MGEQVFRKESENRDPENPESDLPQLGTSININKIYHDGRDPKRRIFEGLIEGIQLGSLQFSGHRVWITVTTYLTGSLVSGSLHSASLQFWGRGFWISGTTGWAGSPPSGSLQSRSLQFLGNRF